jgi:hypothetical protein
LLLLLVVVVLVVVMGVAIEVWKRSVVIVKVCVLTTEEGLFVGGCSVAVLELGGGWWCASGGGGATVCVWGGRE